MADLFDAFQELDDDNGSRFNDLVKGCMNYLGSKKSTCLQIHELLPRQPIWVDVFGGSGVMTMSHPGAKLEIYNDYHGGLVSFFIALNTDMERLIETIKNMPHSREFFRWAYETRNQDTDHFIRGAKAYYLIQTSFSGIGDSWGRIKKPAKEIGKKLHNPLEYFSFIRERMKFVQIENLPWSRILADYDNYDVLFYMDPPYYGRSEYDLTFPKEEHVSLLKAVFECKAAVAVSGYPCPLYDQQPWDSHHDFEVTDYTDPYSNTGVNKTHVPKGKRASRLERLWIKEAD